MSAPRSRRSPSPPDREHTALELCAGGGGQSIGLETAGFHCAAAVELDSDACKTLRNNLPHTNIIEGDLRAFNGRLYEGVDLVAGGVPCPPFSIAGKQLGAHDERDLFPEALRIIREAGPRAVMLENVRGFCSAKFAPYRQTLLRELKDLGFVAAWRLLQASDHGVPQLRPRFLLVALKDEFAPYFRWPSAAKHTPTVGDTLYDLMSAGGWPGTKAWVANAQAIAPTIVGGSKNMADPIWVQPARAQSGRNYASTA